MKNEAVVGPNGRITIPSELRKRHSLAPGMKVVFIEDSDRLGFEVSKFTGIEALRGSLAGYPLEEELQADRAAERNREDEVLAIMYPARSCD